MLREKGSTSTILLSFTFLVEVFAQVYSMFLFKSVPRCLVFPGTGCCFKLISIEPPRSSVHHVEEEGEGFCEQQKWNQEIGPKILNFHPRLLNCPECTLLPKVMIFYFDNGEGAPVFSGEVRLVTIPSCMANHTV